MGRRQRRSVAQGQVSCTGNWAAIRAEAESTGCRLAATSCWGWCAPVTTSCVSLRRAVGRASPFATASHGGRPRPHDDPGPTTCGGYDKASGFSTPPYRGERFPESLKRPLDLVEQSMMPGYIWKRRSDAEPPSEATLWQRIRELQRQGMTVFVTTHYLDNFRSGWGTAAPKPAWMGLLKAGPEVERPGRKPWRPRCTRRRGAVAALPSRRRPPPQPPRDTTSLERWRTRSSSEEGEPDRHARRMGVEGPGTTSTRERLGSGTREVSADSRSPCGRGAMEEARMGVAPSGARPVFDAGGVGRCPTAWRRETGDGGS